MHEERVGFRDAAGKLSITKDQLVREIVSVAEDELAFWSRDGEPLTDRSPAGVERITKYLKYLWDGRVPTMPKKGGGRRAFDPSKDAWSAVFVCYCVTYAFEKLFGRVDDRAAFRKRVPLSRDLWDFQFAKAAHLKRSAGDRGRPDARGHYWAYDAGITVEPGDIVVKDRRRLESGMANLRFGHLRRLAWQSTHADIVTRVEGDTAVLVGGNLGDGVKETRYPLKGGLINRRQRRNAANRVFCQLRLVPQTDDVTATGKAHKLAPKGVKQDLPVAPSDGEWRVVILVPGTKDPVNTNPDSKAGEAYWDEPFLTSLRKFCSPLPRCELVTDFEWSGDNNLEERKKAGERLWKFVRSLPLDPEEPTSVHLIGHSHGGNVINEFTKASAGDMPAEWRIGSITYLSTPFIPAHTPVLTRFAGDAIVLNVVNPYDLTQRVIADYTLAQGPPVQRYAEQAGLDKAIADALARLPVRKFLISDSSVGPDMWESWIGFMAAIQNVTEALDRFSKLLGNDRSLRLLDAEGDVVDILDRLRQNAAKWARSSEDSLRFRLTRWRYNPNSRENFFTVFGLEQDLRRFLDDVLKSINALIGVHDKPVDSPLLILLAGLVINNLDLFSDTSAHPHALYRRDGEESRIRVRAIPIHEYDPYEATGRRAAFEAFAATLEGLQKQATRASQEERKRLLREALLVIIAQLDFEDPLSEAKSFAQLLRFITSEAVSVQLENLISGITTFNQELSSRSQGLFHFYWKRRKGQPAHYQDFRYERVFDRNHAQGPGGIVHYFIQHAHNLSRSKLFYSVEEELWMVLRW